MLVQFFEAVYKINQKQTILIVSDYHMVLYWLEFGQDQSITKKSQGRGKGKASAKKTLSSYMMVDSNMLWSEIQEFAKAKYEV